MGNLRKLTLSIDASVIERARRYSRRHNVSISRLVTNYLAGLDEPKRRLPTSRTVDRLRGILPVDVTVEEHREHLEASIRRFAGYFATSVCPNGFVRPTAIPSPPRRSPDSLNSPSGGFRSESRPSSWRPASPDRTDADPGHFELRRVSGDATLGGIPVRSSSAASSKGTSSDSK